MGNVAIGYFNRLRPGLVPAGGSWRAAFPAANSLTQERAKVARSSTAANADTKMSVPLGATRTLRVLGFDGANLTASAQVRYSLGTTSFGTEVYAGSTVNWLQATGVESSITEHGASLGDFPYLLVLPQDYSASYVTVEIFDAANPAGYVDIGFQFAGPAFIPSVNPEFGSLGTAHIERSTKTRARGGAMYSDPGRRIRRAEMSLAALTDAEAITWHEIERVLGTVGTVAFVPDIADAPKTQREGFFGQIAELTLLENPELARRGKAISIEWS